MNLEEAQAAFWRESETTYRLYRDIMRYIAALGGETPKIWRVSLVDWSQLQVDYPGCEEFTIAGVKIERDIQDAWHNEQCRLLAVQDACLAQPHGAVYGSDPDLLSITRDIARNS